MAGHKGCGCHKLMSSSGWCSLIFPLCCLLFIHVVIAGVSVFRVSSLLSYGWTKVTTEVKRATETQYYFIKKGCAIIRVWISLLFMGDIIMLSDLHLVMSVWWEMYVLVIFKSHNMSLTHLNQSPHNTGISKRYLEKHIYHFQYHWEITFLVPRPLMPNVKSIGALCIAVLSCLNEAVKNIYVTDWMTNAL